MTRLTARGRAAKEVVLSIACGAVTLAAIWLLYYGLSYALGVLHVDGG